MKQCLIKGNAVDIYDVSDVHNDVHVLHIDRISTTSIWAPPLHFKQVQISEYYPSLNSDQFDGVSNADSSAAMANE